MLNILKYEVRVSASTYAKYYFHLRAMMSLLGFLGSELSRSQSPLDVNQATKVLTKRPYFLCPSSYFPLSIFMCLRLSMYHVLPTNTLSLSRFTSLIVQLQLGATVDEKQHDEPSTVLESRPHRASSCVTLMMERGVVGLTRGRSDGCHDSPVRDLSMILSILLTHLLTYIFPK
jgi:hypothetical protein